ncbi:hypothetical protein Salat_0180300 [Sesamum alatum]|uniref:Uncharacterized protein n=1 Tax=Sesamum alatum TaxID=300844 RepID=A0AAE1YXI6_9LAMI|nr:hypothetical protein Salat_0180300 [Sesamum alatum]
MMFYPFADSPIMNARIARLSRALMDGPAPVVAARSFEAEDSVAQGGDPPGGSSGHPTVNPPAPTEVAGNVTSMVAAPPEGAVVLGANTDASGSKEAEVAALGGGDEGPSKKCRRKGKKHRSKGSSKSSKRNKSRSELRAAKDAAEEAEKHEAL